MKYQIWVKDHGETINDANLFESKYKELAYVAELYAEYYYYNHGGWDVSWPIVFSIGLEGLHLGDYSVERESRPYFHAKIAP